MKKISGLFIVLITFTSQAFNQNSLLLNPNFESTTWPAIAWMTQTNTGASIICNENDPIFAAANITARSGSRFAYIGGGQTPKGKYEGSLAQEFEVPYSGIGNLTFYYKYIRESVDPGSYVKILIDGNEVWSIAPHFIVDADENYVQVQINIGHIDAGQHTFELQAYEFPLGGDLPMQFAFDDISFQSTSTASVEQNNTNQLNVVVYNGMIQLSTSQSIDQDVMIELIDLNGKSVLSNKVRFTNHMSIEKPVVSPGIYVISIKTNQQIFTKKVYLQ